MSNTRDVSKKFDSVALYRIRKLLSDLSNKTGRGTELVTLYLPPKKPVHEAIAALREESGTASNIKSDTTRNHVQDALTKTMARLRLYKSTPENGLVIFCGAIPGPGGPGNETIELYEVLPQKPVSNYLYRCDDHFHLDALRDMLREQNVVGILSIDANEAGLGIVSGEIWDVVDTLTSGVSGKTRKGGQCISADSLVQLENGSVIPIEGISAGSKIASYDFARFRQGQYKVADKFSLVPDEYYLIETRRPMMQIKATSEHRFFTLDENGVTTKQAFQLKEGDRIIVSRKLPEAIVPNLKTRFPTRFVHRVSKEGSISIKQLRIKSGKSQKELSHMLGLHQTEISQLERGERNLEWNKLMKVIGALSSTVDEFIANYITTRRVLPEFFTPKLLQLMGYITGDGCVTGNRVALYEQRRDVAELYASLTREVLHLEYVPIITKDRVGKGKSFAKHEYFETRIYSKDFADALLQLYPEIVSKDREIPIAVHQMDNKHLSSFVRGLFDAEGYVRERRIGISMKSGRLIRQLQILLLRFGIVSSYRQYVNRFGSLMHSLDIGDRDSVRVFRDVIGFSAIDKNQKLQICADRVDAQSYLNVPALGSSIDKKAKLLKIRRRQFDGITNYFSDTRGISASVFPRIIKTFQGELVLELGSATPSPQRLQLLESTISELFAISTSGLILAYVKKISIHPNAKKEKFYDIELPDTLSFVGNGFVLHNSARRYERLREMELGEYYKRVADHAKKTFLDQYKIKGLIVIGPGPTKDEFVKDKYLDYRLQNIIVGVLDGGYSGREGVREAMEKSGSLLENVRVIEERKLVQKFLREVNSDTGLAIYGIHDILAALKRAAVETILVSEEIDTTYLKATCNKCGNVTEKFVTRPQLMAERQNMLICPKCGSNEVEISERDIVDYLADASIDSGANVEVISSKTEDGAMLKSFGGLAALLRYKA